MKFLFRQCVTMHVNQNFWCLNNVRKEIIQNFCKRVSFLRISCFCTKIISSFLMDSFETLFFKLICCTQLSWGVSFHMMMIMQVGRVHSVQMCTTWPIQQWFHWSNSNFRSFLSKNDVKLPPLGFTKSRSVLQDKLYDF